MRLPETDPRFLDTRRLYGGGGGGGEGGGDDDGGDEEGGVGGEGGGIGGEEGGASRVRDPRHASGGRRRRAQGSPRDGQPPGCATFRETDQTELATFCRLAANALHHSRALQVAQRTGQLRARPPEGGGR